MELFDKVKGYVYKYDMLKKGDTVVAGISGGADSMYMLYCLIKLKQELELEVAVVHVNHGIRGEEAQRDEEFVKKYALDNKLKYVVYHADIPSIAQREKISEEEAGRDFRYKCFREMSNNLSNGKAKIAVAHHMNDQAETVLFQMLRGSALKGMCGMNPVNGNIIRPLLCVCKEDVTDELKRLGICWCTDSTNNENEYSRNKLRNVVIPYLVENIQTETVQHIAATAQSLALENDFIEKHTNVIYKEIIKKKDDKIIVSCNEFNGLHEAIRMRIALKMMEEVSGHRKDITGRHIQALVNLAVGETGKHIELPYYIRVQKNYDELVCYVKKNEKSINTQKKENEIRIDMNGISDEIIRLTIPGGTYEIKMQISDKIPKALDIKNSSCIKYFSCDRISDMLCFRYPQKEDYICIGDNCQKKKLARFMIDNHIPREERDNLWVLADGNHIIWIPQYDRVSSCVYVNDETKEALVVNYKCD